MPQQIRIEANENGLADLQEEAVNSDFFGTDNLRNLAACLDLRLSETKRRALEIKIFKKMGLK